ncbi:hypothetical protein [Maribacter halichondriae]|uniref:hypothetical protein n=1 Tax=Maribacter halichondriae TaxID=2980554 RepID=UPI002359EFC2|nr:hypothetical protein [Maribacter sp. Hal144]
MKKLIVFLFTCTLVANLHSQSDYTKALDGIEWVKIESKSEIILKTHDKNELLIKAFNLEPVPEKAKGLKLVGVGGEDNTDVGFNVVQTGNNLIVQDVRKSGGAEIYLLQNHKMSPLQIHGTEILT